MVASMVDELAPVSVQRDVVSKKKRRRVISLLIDNYDSYTYNIMQLLAQVNGSLNSVIVIKNDDFGGQFVAAWDHFKAQASILAAEEDQELVTNVIVSPGPGHPSKAKDFGMCAEAIRHAPVPVLGVCLGHQGLAHVYGGQVIQADEVMHGRTSRVVIERSDAFFAFIPNGFQVVRYHSLVVNPSNVPEALEVLAKSQDGVIMAVRHRIKHQYGVQFHPEAVCSEFGHQLLQNFRDVTLNQRPSKCKLRHCNRLDQNLKVFDQCMKLPNELAATAPNYRVTIQRALTGLASVDFAEHVFCELFSDAKRSFWLDSSNYDSVDGTGAARQSRCSMMGDDSGPLSYCVEFDVIKLELRVHRRLGDTDDEETHVYQKQDILSHVREVMQTHQSHEVVIDDIETAKAGLPFAFRGGFVGFFGYEVLESDHEVFSDDFIKQTERVPDASLLFADRSLVFDHRDNVVYTLSLCECKANSERSYQKWHESTKEKLSRLSANYRTRDQADALASLNNQASSSYSASGKDDILFRPSRSRAQYMADIAEIQRLIRLGETYEVCLTNHLRSEYALHDPLAFYCMLRSRNPAPFAGFYLANPMNHFQTLDRHLKAGRMVDTYAVCCSSPERFLHMKANGWMESKPIKGTRPRGLNPESEKTIIAELANCEKDRAENMMIADLVRNDFGVVARVGSVHVPCLMGVETYATVHQLVTTVRAQRRENVDVVDVLRATFPGGSMTGAPKKRTMKIIRELERAPRGIYSGGLGFISIDGSCDLNIIIRTAIVTPQSVTLGAGGAIVALSDTGDEYDEMLLKARALVDTIGVYATRYGHGAGARVVFDS